MPTQLINAKRDNYTDEMKFVAEAENVDIEFLREKIAQGRVVILKNSTRVGSIPVAIGEGLKTKVCAYIESEDSENILDKITDKTRVISQTSANLIMDLSFGKLIDETRQAVLSTTRLPVGINPIYQSTKDILERFDDITKLSKDKIFFDLERQCLDGVDLVSINCALTKNIVNQIIACDEFIPIQSKSGIIIASYIKATQNENPYYEYFDEILEILKKYDIVLSINSSLRNSSIVSPNDKLQLSEAVVMGELVKRAKEKGVQVMVEAIGHTSIHKIPTLIQTFKELTENAPLKTRELITCDYAIGYHNITSTIGNAIAAKSGADMLSAITNAQYLKDSTNSQILEAITSAKIAAISADINLANNDELNRNIEFSEAKNNNDIGSLIYNSIDNTIFQAIHPKERNNSEKRFDTAYFNKLYKKYFN